MNCRLYKSASWRIMRFSGFEVGDDCSQPSLLEWSGPHHGDGRIATRTRQFRDPGSPTPRVRDTLTWEACVLSGIMTA